MGPGSRGPKTVWRGRKQRRPSGRGGAGPHPAAAPSRLSRSEMQGSADGRACTTHRRRHDEVHSGRSRRQENELSPGIY